MQCVMTKIKLSVDVVIHSILLLFSIGSLDSLQNNKLATTGARLKPPKKDAIRSNRFGFRQANTVRPASVGLTPKHGDFDGSSAADDAAENIVNNNASDMVKRRSKSASATTRNSVTFCDTVMVQPVKKTPSLSRRAPPAATYHHGESEQGCRVINSDLHTNNM